MKKRILSLALAFAVMASLVSFQAFAIETSPTLPEGYEDAYKYFYTGFDGTALDTGFTVNKAGAVTPVTIGNDTVARFYSDETTTILFTLPDVTNRNATDSDAVAELNDLVLEYRFKTHASPINESQSYFAYANSKGYTRTLFMAAPSYSLRDAAYWYQKNPTSMDPPKTPVASFDTLTEWHTFSVVYPADKPGIRQLYVDGVYYGESDDVSESKAEPNPWATTGSAKWQFGAYSKNKTASFYLDYVTAYEKPSHFIAEIEGADDVGRDYVVLSFNNAFGTETVKPSSFTVTNGTETVKVSDIERLSEDKIKINFSELLAKDSAYTLNISGVKDNLATDLYNTSVTFTTNSEDVYSEEKTYYYNGFEGTDPELAYYLTSVEVDYGNEVTEDGKSVFKVQGLDVHQNAGNPDFRTPPVSFTETNAPDELMLEYRLRLNVPNDDAYLGVWKTDVRSEAVALGRYADKKDKVFFRYTDKEPITEDFSVDTSKWTTVTIAYPKDVQKRKVYVNGTYLGESPEGNQENTFASARETALTFLTDFKSPEDILEVDYVKYYKKSLNFNARVTDAKSTGVTVEFNSTPANLTKDAVAFSDGTAVSVIKEIDEKTYFIIPETALSSGTNSLAFNGVSDTVCRALEVNNISFEVSGEEENVYVYSSFNDSGLPDGFYLPNNNYINSYTAGDGSMMLYSGNLATIIMNISDINNPNATAENQKANLPELVYEFKCKYDYNTGATNNKYTYFAFRDNSKANLGFGAKSYSTSSPATGEEVVWKIATGEKPVTSLNVNNNWHTYAIVYSNTKNERSLYIDGEYVATSPESTDTGDNYWFDSGKSKASLVLYDKVKSGDSIEFDYIKAYTPAEEIKAEVTSVSDDLKSVYVKFNTYMAQIEPQMFKASGVAAESVDVFDFDNHIYEVKFADKLVSGSSVDLVIDGVVSTLGKKCYDVVEFNTRAAEEIEIGVICENADAGVISVNGTNSATATVTEDSDVPVYVKANLNYTAAVTADGKTLEPDKAGNYTVRNVTPDTEIKVVFAETVLDATATKNRIPTTRQTYSYGTATWAFASLRKEATDYGFIAAKTTANLTLEAVAAGNAIKIPASNINALGEYGVLIMDKNNKFNGLYYVIPYAVYDVGTVYGTSVLAGHKR